MMAEKIVKISKLGSTWVTKDPFLFCVHHLDIFPIGNEQLEPNADLDGRDIGQDFSNKDGWSMYHGQHIPGFPVHPHRGFETITIVEKGIADHCDSLGSTGRFGEGDVQWMTAGRGVQHSEMFPLVNMSEPNTLELFQIWLNLPRRNKMVEPNYKMLWSETIPIIKLCDVHDKQISIKVIAGNYGEVEALTPPPYSWASEKDSELAVWLIKMDAGAHWHLAKTLEGLNRVLYFFRGDTLLVDNYNIACYHSIELLSDENIDLFAGKEEVSILLLQGRPINEPVVQYGPFVMNSNVEIEQAFAEYRKTQFGGWPWPLDDYTHKREQKRFARYADGTIEEP